jgi:MFS family permease
MSNRLAAALDRRNVHYGWIVVASTFLSMLVTAAAMGAPGVLIVPLEKEFGWTTSEISAALALRILLYGLLGPFAAAFMNRFGVRRVVVVALGLISCGFILSLGMTTLWQLMLLWGVVIGLGTGLTAMVLAATVATRWFNKRRGLVIGLLAASSATGQLVFLPVIAQFTTDYGWRVALAFMCGMLALTALMALALLRDRPADLALPLYGETEIAPPPARTEGLWLLMLSPILVLKDVAHTGVFWVLFATFFICGFSTNGLVPDAFCHLLR